jgi:membrane peptidoglycan carboxypeptidase
MSATRQATPRKATARTQPTTIGWLAVILFLFLAGLGAVAAVAAVGAYNGLATGLQAPSTLTQYVLPQETVIYDRTGTIELARFGNAKREVVTFDQIPPILLDATTAVEDKTFWENAGFDPVAIVSAAIDSLRGDSRGASTITQQLVRARLLDADLVQDPSRNVERKLKEIIQSIRVTQYFSGEEGKQEIITAYLNQNYYGNQSYGVKAAVRTYFGIDLADIDPAQAAIIAGLPKSPSNYDLVRNAIEQCDTVVDEGAECPKGHLVVQPDTTVVQRRNQILDLLAEGRTPMSGNTYTAADFIAAKQDPVVLAGQSATRWVAPHFVWAVRDELADKLCGPDTPSCDALDFGGLRVTSTLDVGLQKIAEKWTRAAAIVPRAKNPAAAARALGFDKLEPWMKNLQGKNLHNSAMVALDYQTGELIAYVGSANYYASSSKKSFQPQFDVVGKGYRQPGSAFKPFNYATGINDKTLTASTMLMDVGTDFGGNPPYKPNDADRLERGPVRVRNALQFSLNIPSVKAMGINGPDHVFAKAQDFGMVFQGPRTADLALALGVQEVRPVDLVTAYGTLGNGGRMIPHTTILAVKDTDGRDVVDPYVPPAGEKAVSPQAAFIVTDILAGNTNPNVNPYWGKFAIRSPDGRRPATLKTGTNNDAKDLNAYGYIAPPTNKGRDAGAYALAVGVWNGNSDNSLVSTAAQPLFSIDVSTYVWQGFLQEASRDWPITDFARPDTDLVRVRVDPWTGLPSSGSDTVNEWFIAGTAPQVSLGPDTCGIDVVFRVGVETPFDSWIRADRDWLRRAERGAGTIGGPERTRVSYFYNGSFQPYGASWGALVGGSCGPQPTPSCYVVPTPDPSGVTPSFAVPSPSGSEVAALPCPTSSPLESPSESPSEAPSATPTEPPPTPAPTPTAAPTATPKPTPAPTPAPTPTPTPTLEVVPVPPAP